jgi:creatinine amidohydrolase
MESKVLMEEMNWEEIRDAVESGKTTVILVSGATEQHGPHLPTGTDTILGYAVAARAAVQLGNALVAPVIRPALSEHHMGFPGSFTLSWETYLAVLEDCCESLAGSGFNDIVLVSSHGGNVAVMKAVTPQIAKKYSNRVRIHIVDFLRSSGEKSASFLETFGISRSQMGVHSGYGETAMMLAVAPDLVKMDAAEKGLDDETFYKPDHIPRSQIDSFIHGIDHFSKNGILGDPRGASVDKGERLMEIAVESLVKAISNVLG